INPAAVACAAGNVRRYGLQDRVVVRAGDLFAPVADEWFDLILCNPPYFQGTPHTLADAAFLGGPQYEWLDRFAAEAGAHLAPGGRILVVLGDAADVPALLARLAAPGWRVSEVARRDLWMEMLYIYALTPRLEAAG
ncbi:MAG TPA: methyltransferase, partial [Chloroflexia bacterium]